MRAVIRNSVTAPDVLILPDGKGAAELKAARAYCVELAKAKASEDATAKANTLQSGKPKTRVKAKVKTKGVKKKAAKRKGNTKHKAFGFAIYKDPAVKAALEQLFYGKCAYCESYYSAQAPVDVEHFRPKGAVEGAPDHPGYWWLAMAWSNLLPSCLDCNRRRKQQTPEPKPSLGALYSGATMIANTGKKDVFPVAGTRAIGETDDIVLEEPYLIDPARENPDDHLEYYIEPSHLISLVLPRITSAAAPVIPAVGNAADVVAAAEAAGVSVRGSVSIQVYGLNRLGLVQARTRLLRHLEFLRQLITDIDGIAASLAASADPIAKEAATKLDQLSDRIVAEIAEMAKPQAPYSALVTHWKRRFLADL